MNHRYKKAGVWLARPETWQYRQWLERNYKINDLPEAVRIWYNLKMKKEDFPEMHLEYIEHIPNGLVDCITYGSMVAWAYTDINSLEVHHNCLKNRIRWPRELTPPGKPKMRSIKSLTRDPFIGHYFACFKLNRWEMIKDLKMPLWLLGRYVRHWRKFLLTGNPYHRDVFEKIVSRRILWGSMTEGIRIKVYGSKYRLIKQLHHLFGLNMYSIHLWALMAYASRSQTIKDQLPKYIPPWNLFLHGLCGQYIPDRLIDAFEPQRGYIWDRHEFYNDKPLEPGDEYALDLQLLLKLKMDKRYEDKAI